MLTCGQVALLVVNVICADLAGLTVILKLDKDVTAFSLKLKIPILYRVTNSVNKR
jgi:hypothetical protein